MHRFLAVVLALALFACPTADAQLTLTGAGKTTVAAAAFSGPGDIVASAKGWWGLRAYSVADKGNRLINVCNVSDVACADMSSDATTGALVVTTVGGSDCTMVVCTIKTMYDRSGANNCSAAACDITQATISKRPQLVVSCRSSKPCARFVNANAQVLANAGFTSLSVPYTISSVAIHTGGSGGVQAILCSASAAFACMAYDQNAANQIYLYGGTNSLIGTATFNVMHAAQGVFQASADIYIDGTDTTGSLTSPGAFSGLLYMGALTNNSFWLDGDIQEVGIWPAAFSAGNESSMNSNQHNYWGF